MPLTLKWIKPNTANVKALWSRIREGQFKTAAGLPRFQVVKDVDEPEALFLTWTYGQSALVKCSIDDIPAFLPDIPYEDVEKILRRIARRDLRSPSKKITETDKASQPVQNYVREAKEIVGNLLALQDFDQDTHASVLKVIDGLLEQMVAKKMIRGS